MVYAAIAFGLMLLTIMAATSPRAFVVVLTLALLSWAAWYMFSPPEPKFEKQPPPRVMAP